MSPLVVVLIVAAIAAAFCWIASLVTKDTSWVDRLWSVVPVVYVWIFAAAGLAGGGAQELLFQPGGAGLGEHLPEVLAEQVGPAHAEHALGRGVEEHDLPARVAGQKPVGDVFEHGPQLPGFGVQGKAVLLVAVKRLWVFLLVHVNLLFLGAQSAGFTAG